jgi:hypothetical protein
MRTLVVQRKDLAFGIRQHDADAIQFNREQRVFGHIL